MDLLKTVNRKTIMVFATSLFLLSIAITKISESLNLKWRLKARSKGRKVPLKFPPSFPSVPILGSMLFLPKFSKMHEHFTRNLDKYGPVIAIHFADQYVIMLNGREALYDAFVKKGGDFAGRPKFKFDEFLKKTRKGIIVRQYDDDFKRYHILTINILKKFGFGSKTMESRIHFEANLLIKQLQGLNGEPTCPSLLLFQSVLNVVASLLLGQRFEPGDADRDALVDLIRRSFGEFKELVVVNFFPFLRFVPKFKRALDRGKQLKRDIYQLMDHFIDKCLESGAEDNFIFEFIKEDSQEQMGDNWANTGSNIVSYKDRPLQDKETLRNAYISNLIHNTNKHKLIASQSERLNGTENPPINDQQPLPSSSTPLLAPSLVYDREQLILTLNDLFKAGTETTVSTLEWAFIMMADHQDVQKKCVREIDMVIGRSRLPSLRDKIQMPYLEATIYEIMRHKPVTPLGIPHCTDKDTEVLGYFVPAGTTVFGNLYSALKNTKCWVDPDVFRPERFLSEDGGRVINKELVVNFSMGKRSCTGEILAKHEIFLFLTCVLQHFNISPPQIIQQQTTAAFSTLNISPTQMVSSIGSSIPVNEMDKTLRVDYKEVMDVSLKPTEYKLRFIERH